MPPDSVHVPVLLEATIEALALRPGACCVDATINGGGHAEAILRATAPDGRLLGIDRDPEVLAGTRRHFAAGLAAGRVCLARGSFVDLAIHLNDAGFGPVEGVLFDLGVSSFHFDASRRGFSYTTDEPLDMRFDPDDPDCEPATRILAERSAQELTRIFRDFGEERFASRIARTIVAWRREEPVARTARLRQAVAASLPPDRRWRADRSAARIFQALRIAANNELDAVRRALPAALDALAPGGRLVVISFHSMEDRIVKNFLRDSKRQGHLDVMTRKPLRPTEDETRSNPRAASARLRAAAKLPLRTS